MSAISDLAQNPKVAGVVSTGTISASFFDSVPISLGNAATVVGILLSLVLIYTHLRNGRIDYKKTELEILILKEKEAQIIEAANRRRVG